MKHTFYEVTIIEQGRHSLKEKPEVFNVETKRFSNLAQIKQFLISRYGEKVVKKKAINPVFSYSFWNKDLSHDSPWWYQTDNVVVEKVKETRDLVPIS